MGTVSKTYEVGDTVYVNYPQTDSAYYTSTSRVVAGINVTAASNVANVTFTSGNSITDSDASSTVYTTAATAAAARISEIVTDSAALVAVDTTTSIVSTAGASSTTLGRIG